MPHGEDADQTEVTQVPPAKRSKVNSDESKSVEQVVWPLEDPSEYRPEFAPVGGQNWGKEKEGFRVFYEESGPRYNIVKKTYMDMHTNQTVDFVKKMHSKYSKGGKVKVPMMKAILMLDDIIDESDPDVSEPNSFHLFQTAERIRMSHPDKDWLQLTGLIHDVGKVLALWGEPQWAVVGDTFPVGCTFSEKCVFHETFKDNPDSTHPIYSTKYGMYEPNCGINNIMMSFGHDEYLYQTAVRNKFKLPSAALYIIRFHSFYPWHTGGAYDHLCNDEDREMLAWINEFNKFDLYSKADVKPDIEALKPYYQSLIDKFCPGEIDW